jgi:hypothetical protein
MTSSIVIFEGAWHTRAHDAKIRRAHAQVLSGLGQDPLFLGFVKLRLTAVNDSAQIAPRVARSAFW